MGTVHSTDLQSLSAADDLLGHQDVGSARQLGRVSRDVLAAQLAGSGPLADRINEVAVGGGILVKLLSELNAIVAPPPNTPAEIRTNPPGGPNEGHWRKTGAVGVEGWEFVAPFDSALEASLGLVRSRAPVAVEWVGIDTYVPGVTDTSSRDRIKITFPLDDDRTAQPGTSIILRVPDGVTNTYGNPRIGVEADDDWRQMRRHDLTSIQAGEIKPGVYILTAVEDVKFPGGRGYVFPKGTLQAEEEGDFGVIDAKADEALALRTDVWGLKEPGRPGGEGRWSYTADWSGVNPEPIARGIVVRSPKGLGDVLLLRGLEAAGGKIDLVQGRPQALAPGQIYSFDVTFDRVVNPSGSEPVEVRLQRLDGDLAPLGGGPVLVAAYNPVSADAPKRVRVYLGLDGVAFPTLGQDEVAFAVASGTAFVRAGLVLNGTTHQTHVAELTEIRGAPEATKAPIVHSHSATDIDDATALGRSVLMAGSEAAARAAIGAASTDAATTLAAGLMSGADKTKLDGVAAGATANDTDANLKNRANHTGSQPISTVTGLQAALDAEEDARLTAVTALGEGLAEEISERETADDALWVRAGRLVVEQSESPWAFTIRDAATRKIVFALNRNTGQVFGKLSDLSVDALNLLANEGFADVSARASRITLGDSDSGTRFGLRQSDGSYVVRVGWDSVLEVVGMRVGTRSDAPVETIVGRRKRRGLPAQSYIGVEKLTGHTRLRIAETSRPQLAQDLIATGLFAGVGSAAEPGGPVEFLMSEGDSRSVGGSGSADGQAAVYPDAIDELLGLMFNVGASPNGDVERPPSEFISLEPLHDSLNPNIPAVVTTQLTGALAWRRARDVEAGRMKATTLSYSNGCGGATIQDIGPSGPRLFENGTIATLAAKRLAAERNRTVVAPYVFLKLGMNNRSTAQATIRSLIEAHIAERSTQIMSILGQAVPPYFILSQTETPAQNAGLARNQIAMAQYEVAEANPGVVLGICPYWFKDDFGMPADSGEDRVHNYSKGYALEGEWNAEIKLAVDLARVAADDPALPAGDVWKGIKPQSVTRVGAELRVSFWPNQIVAPLVFDTTWFPAADDFGIHPYTADLASRLTISGAGWDIDGLDLVCTLSSDPGGPVMVTAGYTLGAGAIDRSGTWINLRDSAEIPTAIVPGGVRPHWSQCWKMLSN
ncbi:hypothetical protein [Hansschlegelia zhihuaiae]|uniref:Uncharacterized protein n=1 Tax=Hansschlegelia zhihuaiae TaxID=405005 RepID=A0A4Q0MGL1_9HYPH|nr:hypothetical protein [Hansschlegelia zhihuaiae]RXF72129.1 hypothetical protein EK403_15075 [Hansschlegelia zhihuaiae]